MELGEATSLVTKVTGRGTLRDALAYLAEGRHLPGVARADTLMSALAELAEFGDERSRGAARAALNRFVDRALVSDIDSSAELFAVDTIVPPTTYRKALDELARHTANGGLANVNREAVYAAQRVNRHVLETLANVAGLSYGDLQARAAVALPGAATSTSWTAEQTNAAFDVIDPVIRGVNQARLPGAVAARPIELLLAQADHPRGWAAVDRFRRHGVPFEVLLTQRAVGGAWNAHRSGTQNEIAKLMFERLSRQFHEADVAYWRLGEGGARKAFLAERIAVGKSIGAVGLVTHRDGRATLAVTIALAKDGGTARRSGGTLAKLPTLLRIPAAALLVGPGWAQRSESGDLVRAYGGRIFTDRTLPDLVELAATVSATTDAPMQTTSSTTPRKAPKPK
jgi:hypothetical protein